MQILRSHEAEAVLLRAQALQVGQTLGEVAQRRGEQRAGGRAGQHALVAERPHPELFLEYPRGLGMNLQRFENVKLLPAAKAYRKFLDNAIQRRGWDAAAAIVTLFIDRKASTDGKRPWSRLLKAIIPAGICMGWKLSSPIPT